MRIARLAAAAVMTVGACTRGGYRGPEGIQPLPTTVEDTYAVPDVIDAAYVNRVLAALDKVNGDAVRRVVASDRTDDALMAATLRAVYNDPQFAKEMGLIDEVPGRGRANFKRPPGNRRTTVVELLSASPRCILVKADIDFAAVVVKPIPRPPEEIDLFTLRPTQVEGDPRHLNPTPWSFSHIERVRRDAEVPEEARCEG